MPCTAPANSASSSAASNRPRRPVNAARSDVSGAVPVEVTRAVNRLQGAPGQARTDRPATSSVQVRDWNGPLAGPRRELASGGGQGGPFSDDDREQQDADQADHRD